MAKFRSWNEKYKRFHYFEDGEYYYFVARISDKVIVRVNEENNKYDLFNWQNAEQSTVISCSNSDKVECFENDYLEIKADYPNSCEMSTGGYSEVTIEGYLKLDSFGFYISSKKCDNYLIDLPTIVSVVVKKEEEMTLAEKALKNLEKKRSEMSKEEFDTYLDENTKRAKAKVFGEKGLDNEA